MRTFFTLLVVTTSLSACEQMPAQVVDKGKNSYASRNYRESLMPQEDHTTLIEPKAAIERVTAESIVANDLPAMRGFIVPVEGPIVSNFGDKESGVLADGINIEAREGAPVRAVADGEVVYIGNQLKSYGTMVIIKHTGKQNTSYAHLMSANVRKGQRVNQGDIIGSVGTSGAVTSPQLHFAVREGSTPKNPMHYLPSTMANLKGR